jgi:hypothetical protein
MATIKITRGSDKTLQATWRDSAGTAINLTGHTIEVFDTKGIEASRITTTIINALTGRFDVKIEGTAPIRLGNKSFRLKITPTGGDSTGSLEIPIEIV